MIHKIKLSILTDMLFKKSDNAGRSRFRLCQHKLALVVGVKEKLNKKREQLRGSHGFDGKVRQLPQKFLKGKAFFHFLLGVEQPASSTKVSLIKSLL